MKTLNRVWMLASLALVLTSASTGQQPQPAAESPAEKAPKLEHFDATLVDRNLDPCQDFYQYVCHKWTDANPIPPDQASWGTLSGLRYWNEDILRKAMQNASQPAASRSTYEQEIGDYWAACMDEPGIEAAGTRDLKPDLERIRRMKNKSELAGQVAHLHMLLPEAWSMGDNQTNAPLLGLGQLQDFDDASRVVAAVDQGGLGLPNRDFYLKDDKASTEILRKYEAHIAKMLRLAGEDAAQSSKDATTVLAIEKAMAQAQMDNVARRDPKNLNNKMSLKEIAALTPSFSWNDYLRDVEAPKSEPHYLVLSPQYLRGLEKIIQQRSLDDWKAYLRWHLVHGSAPYLSRDFVDENWDMFIHTIFGSQKQLPRWRRCVRAADHDLGFALGRAYVEVAFPPESKQRTKLLVDDVRQALDQDITGLEWMQPVTKEQAKVKLRAIEEKIGYPDHWRDYSSVKIVRSSYLDNVHGATAFEFHRQLNKIGKPVDRSEWLETPPTIDAYYDAQTNSINFDAGILQPPLFDKTMDYPVNYGGIGMVIGHEITHGFDDQGRKFDAKGNLRDWWTPADAKAYDERGACIVDEYTQEVPEAGVKQDGHLTQGEDTADNGGLRLALMALTNRMKAQGKSMDESDAEGWTPRQRFFLSYAHTWCSSTRPETMRTQVLTNPHSLPKYRVNNVISNMPEFQQAFSCKAGTPMVHAKQCRVW